MIVFVNRIWIICTEKSDRDLEIDKLKHTLSLNQYPADMVNAEIEKFVKYLSKPAEPKPSTVEPELKRFIVLPYANRKCEDFAIRLKRLVSNSFPQVDFN